MKLALSGIGAAAGLLVLAGCADGYGPHRPEKMSRNDRTTYERDYCSKKGNTDDVLECRRNSQDIPGPLGAGVGTRRTSDPAPNKTPTRIPDA